MDHITHSDVWNVLEDAMAVQQYVNTLSFSFVRLQGLCTFVSVRFHVTRCDITSHYHKCVVQTYENILVWGKKEFSNEINGGLNLII